MYLSLALLFRFLDQLEAPYKGFLLLNAAAARVVCKMDSYAPFAEDGIEQQIGHPMVRSMYAPTHHAKPRSWSATQHTFSADGPEGVPPIIHAGLPRYLP